jgi:hypothetical protein
MRALKHRAVPTPTFAERRHAVKCRFAIGGVARISGMPRRAIARQLKGRGPPAVVCRQPLVSRRPCRGAIRRFAMVQHAGSRILHALYCERPEMIHSLPSRNGWYHFKPRRV